MTGMVRPRSILNRLRREEAPAFVPVGTAAGAFYALRARPRVFFQTLLTHNTMCGIV